MHEYPITLEIIRLAENAALKRKAVKIKKIALVVGDNSGYVGDSIRMYFDAISRGTLCEGAELLITRIRPLMQCSACQKTFERKPFTFDCPHCGGEGHPTSIGNEFYIDYIEAEATTEEATDGYQN